MKVFMTCQLIFEDSIYDSVCVDNRRLELSACWHYIETVIANRITLILRGS